MMQEPVKRVAVLMQYPDGTTVVGELVGFTIDVRSSMGEIAHATFSGHLAEPRHFRGTMPDAPEGVEEQRGIDR